MKSALPLWCLHLEPNQLSKAKKESGMKKRVAVVLSGCGNLDGSEIQESVSVLIALSELGADVQCFAPDQEFQVKNFLTKKQTGETRNLLLESARIARSDIKKLNLLNVKDFDALVFPGGYGAANNLSTFGTHGADAKILPEVEQNIRLFHAESKPIGAICIAPVLIALSLGKQGVMVTVGEKCEASGQIEKTGAQHMICAVDDFITDREHKIVTTPAYMYDDATPFQVFKGIRKAMQELYEMA